MNKKLYLSKITPKPTKICQGFVKLGGKTVAYDSACR